MNNKVLVLDCDGVIFNSIPLIDSYVKEIKYEASDAYMQDLELQEMKLRMANNRLLMERDSEQNDFESIQNEMKEIENLRKTHFQYKDQVLEETDEEYRDLIDYFKIFILENTFTGVVDILNQISSKNVYDDIYVLSHVNSVNETDAKKAFFAKYLPMVKFIPVYFHTEPFYNEDGTINNKRKRTNKMKWFLDYVDVDPENVYFADDTLSIVTEAKGLNVKHSYFKNENDHIVELLTKVYFDTINDIDKKEK